MDNSDSYAGPGNERRIAVLAGVIIILLLGAFFFAHYRSMSTPPSGTSPRAASNPTNPEALLASFSGAGSTTAPSDPQVVLSQASTSSSASVSLTAEEKMLLLQGAHQ